MSTMPTTFDKDAPRFEENPQDFFETPIELATACLKLLVKILPRNVLDIGCGTGVWGRAAESVWPNAKLYGVDVVNRMNGLGPYDHFYQNNFLDVEIGTFGVVAGNPPYSAEGNRNLAADLVLHGIDHLTNFGRLGFLLKTEFLNADNRYNAIFSKNPPLQQWVIVQRPSFYGNGRSNTICYSFFIWGKENPLGFTETRWLSWR